ncbi:MAG: potassium channel family protein [Candidatus Bilamarchaeaceae archaeon]
MIQQNAKEKKLAVALVVLFFVYLISIFFYHEEEKWGYLDCAYFITMTITTIGYGDITPTTDISKIYTIFLTFAGISIAFYIISVLSSVREKIVDERLHKQLKMMKDILTAKTKKN